MVGWHNRLDGHKFEKTLGDGEGQRNLVGYSPWGLKELDVTERLTQINNKHIRSPHPKSNHCGDMMTAKSDILCEQF